MKQQKFAIEGYVYVPLPELFAGKADTIGHQRHLQTFSQGNETYHVMAVNAENAEGVGAALQNDLQVIEQALEGQPEDRGLLAQKKVVSGMCQQFGDSAHHKSMPVGLYDAVSGTVRQVAHKSVAENQMVVISALSHYEEF